MVKRKAEGLGEGLSIEEPRRSSRRISKVTTEKPKAKAVDDEPRQSKKRTIKGIEESEREVNGAINIAVKTVGQFYFIRSHISAPIDGVTYRTTTIISNFPSSKSSGQLTQRVSRSL